MSNDDVSMGDESPTPALPEMGTIDPALLVAETMIARANPGGTIDPAAARWAALHVPTDEWIDPVTIT